MEDDETGAALARVDRYRTAPVGDNTGVVATWAVVLAAIAVGLMITAVVHTGARRPSSSTRIQLLVSDPWAWAATGLLVLALVLVLVALAARHRSDPVAPAWTSWMSVTFLLAGVFVAVFVVWSFLMAPPTMKFSSVAQGRPRRRRLRGGPDRAVAPDPTVPLAPPDPSAPSDPPSDPGPGSALTLDQRATVQRMWTRAAGHEAESIASFLQLEAELAAVGAPPALLERARAAAEDEVRHAAFADALAHALSDGPVDDAPAVDRLRYRAASPPSCSRLIRQHRVLRLAVESYVDGCCNEGSEVRRLRHAAEHASPVLREQLAAVAADEEAHAELAWSVVEWAVADGGPAVSWALSRLPVDAVVRADRARSSTAGDEDPALQAWGWVPPSVRRDCVEQARAAARARLGGLVGVVTRAAAPIDRDAG